MFEAWINMWKDGLKFKSPYRTNRRDFWYAFVIDLIVCFSISVLWPFDGGLFNNIVFIFITIVHLIVVTAIAIRRLRDAGSSIYWPIFYIIFAFLTIVSNGSFHRFFATIAMIVCVVILVLCAFPTKSENTQPIQEDTSSHSS